MLPELCDFCGVSIDDGSEVYAIVPDSSVIHPSDPRQDGARVIAGCSRAHLAAVRRRCAQRLFVEEELWAGQIRRFLRQCPSHTLTVEDLAHAVGLSPSQVERAITWQTQRLRLLIG